MVMRLVIVRHGRTVGNEAGINQGWIPGELNDLGKKEAELLAERLAAERIDIVYASDLDRVQETLAPFRKLRPDIEIVVTERLREAALGPYEGTPYGAVRDARMKAEAEGRKFLIEGGETLEQLYDRVASFVDEIIAKHTDAETVCFFTHGGPAIQIVKHLTRFPDEEHMNYHPKNACYHILERHGDNWKLVAKNVHDHLDGLEPDRKWD